jgi:hypothetical protein
MNPPKIFLHALFRQLWLAIIIYSIVIELRSYKKSSKYNGKFNTLFHIKINFNKNTKIHISTQFESLPVAKAYFIVTPLLAIFS